MGNLEPGAEGTEKQRWIIKAMGYRRWVMEKGREQRAQCIGSGKPKG